MWAFAGEMGVAGGVAGAVQLMGTPSISSSLDDNVNTLLLPNMTEGETKEYPCKWMGVKGVNGGE